MNTQTNICGIMLNINDLNLKYGGLMDTEEYLKKITAAGKRFNEAVNQKTNKIVETEKSLREAKLLLTAKIAIPDGNTARPGEKLLAWRSTARDKPYRIIFIGPEMDNNDKPIFISKPFTEAPLKVRLKYVEYLPLLVDEVLKEAKKIVECID